MNEASEPVPFRLETPDSTLNGLVDLPSGQGERPAIVICHDSESFPEWGFLPYLATLLAARGFVAVRPEIRGLPDLLAVLEALGETIAPGRVDRRHLGLLGHGLGGGTAILAAAQPPWRDRLRALVTWTVIADPEGLAAAAEVRAPWLLVQGDEDATVSAGGERELRVIPGASHTFGSRHPFTGPTPQLIQALNVTQRWFRAHL